MKILVKGILFCCLILLGGCATEQPDLPVGDTAGQSVPTGTEQTSDQAINIAPPDQGNGLNQNVQGQGGTSAANAIAPLTQ